MIRIAMVIVSASLVSNSLAAENIQQRVDRLEHGIDRASELGHFDRVQTLRRQLAGETARAGRYAIAARQYELLLASRPGKKERVKLFIELARMRRALQNYGGAIISYQDALHDDADNWDANFELAQTYAQTDINVSALTFFANCVKLRPKSSEAYEGMAAVYQRQGYLNKALMEYQKALALQKRPEIYLAMADCYVRQDHLSKATEILQQGKAILTIADYDARLGDIYYRQGDLTKSAGIWEEAVKSDTTQDEIRLKLVMLYDRLNRRADADRMLRTLEGAYPDSPLVHFLKAWVLYDRGDRVGARDEALHVQRLAPTELVRHYNDRLLALLKK